MGLAYSNLRKARLGGWRYLLPLLLAPSALVGARLLNYVLNPSAYGQEFRPWALSYRNFPQGGLVAGVGALLLFAFCKRQSPWPLLTRWCCRGRGDRTAEGRVLPQRLLYRQAHRRRFRHAVPGE